MIFIANTAYSELIELLSEKDTVVLIPIVDALYDGIRNHPDLHLCIFGQTIFISKEIEPAIGHILEDNCLDYDVISEALGAAYPNTAQLNAFVAGSDFICNKRLIAKSLLRSVIESSVPIIHVNQGYARCTTVPIADHAVITDDLGIRKVLESNGYKVTYVEPGHVMLPGQPYGFIGGTAGVIGDTLYFNGDISQHPGYDAITLACERHGLGICYIKDKPLVDIGSILQYREKEC